MNILFIHQNFPGQYLHLARYIQSLGSNTIVGLGEAVNIKRRGVIQGLTVIGYPTPTGAGKDTHHYLQTTEASLRRGQVVARALIELRQKKYTPDVICVHPGWGEGLFIRDIYPEAPILMFCEFFFRAGQADLSFDTEFPHTVDWGFSVRARNSAQVLSMLTANALVSPTAWQKSRYPDVFQKNMHVLHEGIDTGYMTPALDDVLTLQRLETPGESRVVGFEESVNGESQNNRPLGEPFTFTRKDKIITYIGRNLEPYRGFHVLMRILPRIQRLHPDAHVLIVGGDGTSYSQSLPDGQTYKAKYLAEVGDELDLSHVHFLGRVPYSALRSLFRISSCHLYITYPFVLSWSVLEAMACECLVAASNTAPVREVMEHDRNALLFDFFDRDQLADTVDRALREPESFIEMRKAARQMVLERFELQHALNAQFQLLRELADGKYPTPW